MREYETLTRQYQEMSSKLAAVQLSESAEDQQRGSNFQVLEWPNFPLTPTRPFKASILGAGLTLSLLIALALAFFKGQGEALWPWLMAASVISMLPLALVYLAAQRWFIEGLTFTGLKQ